MSKLQVIAAEVPMQINVTVDDTIVMMVLCINIIHFYACFLILKGYPHSLAEKDHLKIIGLGEVI